MKVRLPLRASIIASVPLLVMAAGMFGAVTFLGREPVALAQSDAQPPQAENQQPWTVNCSTQNTTGELVCTMSQVLIARNTGQRVVAAVVFRDTAAGGAFRMRIGLPHGIMLPEGVATWVDSGPRTTHVIATADQNGSYATVPLENPLLGALRAGQLLNLMVKATGGDEVIFQLSLKGFSAALQKI